MPRTVPLRWGALGLALATAASAHIKLLSPPEWVATSAYGDPQKLGPCGVPPGDPYSTFTDAGITVVAGSTLTVQWAETILHPGHFRLAIAADRATLVDPAFTLTGGLCDTAAIQQPPVAPVLADGVLPHVTASVDGGLWSATLTVPSVPCERCTLQLLQFMSQHGPPCFYYHCATLRIVAAADAGASPDAGTSDDAGTTADPGVAADAGPGGTTADAGATDGGLPTGASGTGCGCQGAGPGLVPLLAAWAWRRRRYRAPSPS
jgi:uncharacterized protein (TIGR03382 family)